MDQIAYCTDEKGYYTHSEYCTVDTLESALQGHDVYVLPTNGYVDAPSLADGCVAKRVNGAWVNVENHIGEKGYVNGAPTEIKEYGPLPEGWSTTPPAPTLEDQLAAIEAKYAPRIAALREGIMSAYLTDGAIMDDNVSGLRTEWAAVIAQRNAEMEALLI